MRLNNKTIVDPSKKISTNDILDLIIPKPKEASLKPYDYKLNIIFEDEDLIVLDKPAGIVVHPGAGNYDNTIVNALLNYNKNSLSNIGDKLRPGIVHRIDKNTSGLIVIAKNNKAHENLAIQFSNHSIQRIYQLLIWGKMRPSKGKIETMITRSSKNRQMMEVSHIKGKKAITNYKTIEINTPAIVTCDLRLNEPRYASLPNIMKAKKKPIEQLNISDLGIDAVPKVELLKVEEPPQRKAGIKVASVAELVQKLKNEAKVL